MYYKLVLGLLLLLLAEHTALIGAAQSAPPNPISAQPLQEYAPSMVLDLGLSQPRAFQASCPQIITSSISDPEIADVIVPALNTVILRGKKAGTATLFLLGSDKTVLGIKWIVNDNQSSEPRAALLPSPGSINLEECKIPFLTDAYQRAKVEFARMRTTKKESQAPYPKRGKGPKTTDYSISPFYIAKTSSVMIAHPTKVSKTFKAGESGTSVDLEFLEHQSRMLKVAHQIVQTHATDCGIVEPVPIHDDKLVLIGGQPGKATIIIKFDKGKALNVKATVKSTRESASLNKGSTLPVVSVKKLQLHEADTKMIEIQAGQPKFFKTKTKLLTVFINDDKVADLVAADDSFYLWGKNPGRTRMFLQDSLGNMSAVEIVVAKQRSKCNKDFEIPDSFDEPEEKKALSAYNASLGKKKSAWRESPIEYWIGEKKAILHVPISNK